MQARSAWHVGSRFEITVEDLAAGGDGVGRVEGWVVFVPRSVPGDRLLVEVERVEARRLHAAIRAVIEPSPDRRKPSCAHFGRCGGCAWQHVDAPAQRAAKGRIVRDALARLGGIVVEAPIEVRHAQEYGWRSRAELHVASGQSDANGGAASVGWLRRGSHAIEPVSACPVLVPALQRVLEDLRSGARAIPDRAARVQLAAGDDDAGVAFDDARGRPLERPEPVVTRTIAGFELEIGTRAFFQGNGAMIETLVATALEGLDAHAGPDSEALDLYCGSGLFALPLAARFTRVLGVEADRGAVERARANALANGVANARFECEDVGSYLHRARRVLRPRTVLLDPPRRGAGAEVVDAIAALDPHEVRYVSCDPATLARDLASFAVRDFGLASIVALDMFPQTPHVECVAILRRSATT